MVNGAVALSPGFRTTIISLEQHLPSLPACSSSSSLWGRWSHPDPPNPEKLPRLTGGLTCHQLCSQFKTIMQYKGNKCLKKRKQIGAAPLDLVPALRAQASKVGSPIQQS